MSTRTTPRPPREHGRISSVNDGRRHRDWRDVFAMWLGRIVMLGAVAAIIGHLANVLLHRNRLDDLLVTVFGIINIPVGPNLLTIILLLVLAGALRRRLRIAAVAVLVYQLLSAIATTRVLWWYSYDQLRGLGTGPITFTSTELVLMGVSAGIGYLVSLVLVLAWRAFPAQLPAGNWARALAFVVGGALLAYGLTVLLSLWHPGRLTDLTEVLVWSMPTALGLNQVVDPPLLHGHTGSYRVAQLTPVVTAIGLVLGMMAFLRSARARQTLTGEDQLRVRRMLLTDGERDSLGYFATREDKGVVYSADGLAAITYRVEAAVCLAAGDPIGPLGSWDGAIEAWIRLAREHGWYLAALSASEDGARAYGSFGMRVVTMGDEAILEVERFDIGNRAMRPVRHAVNRLNRLGYTVSIRRDAEIPASELARLRDLAELWRGEESERGFSMALNRYGDPADGRSVTVLAINAAGEVKGLLHFVPWGMRGLSLDLMRRDRSAENGLTELMVNGLMNGAGELGVRRVSLNFAMFRNIFSGAEQVDAGPLTRLSNRVLGYASRFWQLESLYRSNAKYLPTWVPRYVCYEPNLTLGRAAVAAGLAEGFISMPSFLRSRGEPDHVLSGSTIPDEDFLAQVLAQEDELLHPPVPEKRLNEHQRVRRVKLQRIVDAGMDPYPVAAPRDRSLAQARSLGVRLGPGENTGTVVSVTGRVRAMRRLGGVTFASLQEGADRLQVMLTRGETDQHARRLWHAGVDLGDIVSVTGEVVTSRSGEISVLVDTWSMASKCLHPLPDLRTGLTDPEARVKQRWVDLMVNQESMDVLQARFRAVSAIRRYFDAAGFQEVETPILQATQGGANARPFRTHLNAFSMDMVLRIAPELFLKKLAVAGMPAIYEVGRSFRNEGVDLTHSPEFSSCEAYLAWADYDDMRRLTRECLLAMARAMHGREVALRPVAEGRDEAVDLSGEWPVVPVHQAVSDAVGEPVTTATPLERVRALCAEHGIKVTRDATHGSLVNELYEELVEGQTTFPTFYTDFPIEASPLAAVHRDDPMLAEKWDLVAWGFEIGTAFSENTDPVYQRRRFTEQSLAAAAGDPEAMSLDESFLHALEHGLPPTGGLGFGVERAVMMLGGTSIRPTQPFPLYREG